MAGFRTHLIGGTVTGIACALIAAHRGLVDPLVVPTVALIGVVGGLAPDLDSDTGRPIRILGDLAALIVPTLALWRSDWLTAELPRAALGWLLIALTVRYPLVALLKRLTLHRGVFHSVPAVGVFGCAMFLAVGRRQQDLDLQVAVGLTAAAGYLTHLVLDELWSVDFNGDPFKNKSSMGTALSLRGPTLAPTLLIWALLGILGVVVNEGLGARRPEDLWEQLAPRLAELLDDPAQARAAAELWLTEAWARLRGS